MKAMRDAAAELRRDALAGLTREQQTQFVDTLIAVQANLGGGENGSARNGSVRNGSSDNGPGKNSSVQTGSVKTGPIRNGVRAKGQYT